MNRMLSVLLGRRTLVMPSVSFSKETAPKAMVRHTTLHRSTSLFGAKLPIPVMCSPFSNEHLTPLVVRTLGPYESRRSFATNRYGYRPTPPNDVQLRVGLPPNGAEWTNDDVIVYIRRFLIQQDLSDADIDKIISRINITGSSFFMLDEPELIALMRGDDVLGGKLYRLLGGGTPAELQRDFLGSTVQLLAPVLLIMLASIFYLKSTQSQRQIALAKERTKPHDKPNKPGDDHPSSPSLSNNPPRAV